MKSQILKNFYKLLFDNANDGILLADLETKKFFISNQAICKMLGYSNNEFKNLRVADIHPGENLPYVMRQFERQASGKIGESISAENMPMKRKDGSIFYATISAFCVKLAEKKYLIGIFRDSTNRRQMLKNLENAKIAARNVYEDLQAEKERIAQMQAMDEAILASIADGCIAVDEKGKIILINQTAQKMLGYSSEESIGREWPEILQRKNKNGNLIAPEKGAIHAALSATTTTTSTTTSYYLRKNGTKFPVSRTVSPILLQGKIIGAVNIFRDITKEREIDKSKSEFISIASHQLRTPLTGIKWFSQLLIGQKVGKLSAKQTDFIQQMYNSNERMIRLVNDLLDVSHVETGQKFVIKKKPGDIIVLINKVIKDQRVDWSAKKIAIKLDKFCPAKLILNFDQDKIYQVLSNLISNSIKYSGQGKKIIIGLKCLGDQTRFSIKDFGLGIPGQQKNRVFHRFFRADNIAAISTDSTGLGLYIVKGIVEAHGGKIWFKSKQNKGTTFYFTL